tara:strand:- start:333 stop:635 length:303 start_codon:yes stop_codon:yes gene_type:complete
MTNLEIAEVVTDLQTALSKALNGEVVREYEHLQVRAEEVVKNCSIQSVRQRAFRWWDAMNLDQQFYKTIAANQLIDGDNTRHPHSLNDKEVILIYNFHVA